MTTNHLPGLSITDHFVDVPLDHASPQGSTIHVYVREVVATGKQDADLPALLFLQGGPGGAAPRPESRSGWIDAALDEFRVFLLDQRGTGRSTPATHQTMARMGSPADQAHYLTHFRADAIVRDAELVRRQLLGEEGRWTILGQSFGGFCATTYLSFAPHFLDGVLITGGLPPVGQSADQVYRATYRRLLEQNRRYYARYPQDVAQVRKVMDVLLAQEVTLPSGGILTPRRFQQLGIALGAQVGHERLHYLLEEPFVNGVSGPELSYAFLHGVEETRTFELAPLYSLLHEAIYCEGSASRWSAHRVRDEFPQFAPDNSEMVHFTGEMIYPWMFEDYPRLRPTQEAAELLADYAEWPALYDIDVLAKNDVPCAATIYADDMYVERDFAEATARMIRGAKIWFTNEYVHDAIRADGDRVFRRLLAMMRGEV